VFNLKTIGYARTEEEGKKWELWFEKREEQRKSGLKQTNLPLLLLQKIGYKHYFRIHGNQRTQSMLLVLLSGAYSPTQKH
jgi:hypothetical protein